MVFTSDQVPAELPSLVARLRTRFEEGLMVKLNLPRPEEVRVFAEACAQLRGLELTDEAYDLIGRRKISSFREVKGIVRQLHLHAGEGQVEADVVVTALDGLDVDQPTIVGASPRSDMRETEPEPVKTGIHWFEGEQAEEEAMELLNSRVWAEVSVLAISPWQYDTASQWFVEPGPEQYLHLSESEEETEGVVRPGRLFIEVFRSIVDFVATHQDEQVSVHIGSLEQIVLFNGIGQTMRFLMELGDLTKQQGVEVSLVVRGGFLAQGDLEILRMAVDRLARSSG
jgi:hypothetical protein